MPVKAKEIDVVKVMQGIIEYHSRARRDFVVRTPANLAKSVEEMAEGSYTTEVEINRNPAGFGKVFYRINFKYQGAGN